MELYYCSYFKNAIQETKYIFISITIITRKTLMNMDLVQKKFKSITARTY